MNERVLAPFIYLAGPITHETIEHARGWRSKAAATIQGMFPAVVFDPASAFTVAPSLLEHGREPIQHVNDIAIGLSHALLVKYNPLVPSAGTDHELILSVSLGVPLFVWVHNAATEELAKGNLTAALNRLGIKDRANVFSFPSLNAAIAALNWWVQHELLTGPKEVWDSCWD